MSIFKNGLLFGEKSSDGLIKDQDGNFRVAVIEPRIFNLHDNTQGAASPQVARKYRWSPDSQALFCVKDSSPWSIHKTNQTFRQLEENTSAPLAATTEAIAVNSTHFFAQDWSTYTIRKYLMSNLSYIGQTSSVSNMFTALVADDSFLFIARGTDTIRKYNAGTLAYIGATASISNGGALAIDNTYLYAKRDSVYINKYLKSNFRVRENNKIFVVIFLHSRLYLKYNALA